MKFLATSTLTPLLTPGLCHVIYYHVENNYPCPGGIGLCKGNVPIVNNINGLSEHDRNERRPNSGVLWSLLLFSAMYQKHLNI